MTKDPRELPEEPEKTYFQLFPWRNLWKALLLLLALGAVIALKKSGGGFFRDLIESVGPPPKAAPMDGAVAPDR